MPLYFSYPSFGETLTVATWITYYSATTIGEDVARKGVTASTAIEHWPNYAELAVREFHVGFGVDFGGTTQYTDNHF